MQYTWQFVLVPVYFIKHSVSCYIYYISMRCNVVALLQSWCAVLQLQKGLPSFRRLSAEIVNHSYEWDEYLKVCRTVCFQFSILARITNAVCLCTYTTVHVRTWYTFTCMHVYMFTIIITTPTVLPLSPGAYTWLWWQLFNATKASLVESFTTRNGRRVDFNYMYMYMYM